MTIYALNICLYQTTAPAPKDVNSYLQAIETRMDHQELLNHLKLLVGNIKLSHDKKKSASLDPSQSSQPTGGKWTWEALGENLKTALHINATNTGAIKNMLSLPIKQQLSLLRAISEQ